ncbi:MAG: protein kinase [Chloroflexota bacterium]
MEDIIGQNINQYRLDKLLGEGGMGRVYLAWDVNLDRQVAIKLMHAQLAVQSEVRERLTQEAKTAASLEHPSIVRVYDFGDSEHGLFIAMEYVGGGTLRNSIRSVRKNNRFIQIDQIIQIGVHIAEALDYAHAHSVVHRDVKPGNIIIKQLTQPEKPSGSPFRAMLSDFGLVKVSESTLKTQTGFTMGTPIYMSPEQCHGQDLDGRSDIYSLGVVLYELLTGQPPFSFRSLTEALSTHMKGQLPPSPSIKRGEIPPVLDTVIMTMLAKDPDDRFQHGQQVAEYLRNASGALENTPTRAIPKITRPPLEDDSGIDRKIIPAPEGFSLQLESGQNEPVTIDLKKSVVTIGRSGNNDITLPLDGVSRFNTRLQATSEGWELIDLGGINGTWLNGERISAQQGRLIKPGDYFEIESYRFTLDGPEAEATSEPATPVPPASISMNDPAQFDSDPPFDPDSNPAASSADSEAPEPSSAGLEQEDEKEQLSLLLSRERYKIKAGHSLTIPLEVFNRSREMIRANVRVIGISPDWFRTPPEFTDIPPRTSKSIPVKIHIPRNPTTPVGPQRMRVRIISPQLPNLDTAANFTLDVGGYNEFQSGIEPTAITVPEEVKVTIKNSGNLPGRYAIKLGPYDNKLQISRPLRQIMVPPGEMARVTVPLAPTRPTIFGNRFDDPFNIHVVDLDNEENNRVMSGTVTFRPLLPVATSWFGGLVLLGLIIFSCLTLIVRQNEPGQYITNLIFGEPTESAFTMFTPTPPIDVSAVAATSAAENATAAAAGTVLSTTATPPERLTDTDGDGLSNGQEEVVKTSITEPDTDRDGVNDGDEVLVYGTDPLIQDSDRDGILDGQEILQYQTDPLSADTDGDGVSDADEIRAGTDPRVGATLIPPSATPAPTSDTPPTDTPIPPTATQTPVNAATNTPIVVTNTPTETPFVITATPIPATEVPTLAPTDIPTEVPTEIPTLVPTEIPTEVPTEVPTEIPTEIPTEEPTVAPEPTATESADVIIDPPSTAFSLACNSTFQADGIVGAEWSSSLIYSGTSTPNSSSTLDINMHKDAANLYIGLFVYGSPPPTDSTITLIFENQSGGDPDQGDMQLLLTRAGVFSVQTGTGTNADGVGWAQFQGSETIILASNQSDAPDWQAEIQIPLSIANSLLSPTFSLGVQADLAGEVVSYPADSNLSQTETLAIATNPVCQ